MLVGPDPQPMVLDSHGFNAARLGDLDESVAALTTEA
jgi:hypothetical protein